MKTIGKVELIINSQYLLISSEEELKQGQVVLVFVKLDSEDVKKKLNVESISLPKGEVSIVHQEKEKLYLAEVFQYTSEKRRVISHPSAFDKLTAGALRSLLEYSKEEIINQEPGHWSGVLDKKTSLDFEYDKKIQIGDLIGFP